MRKFELDLSYWRSTLNYIAGSRSRSRQQKNFQRSSGSIEACQNNYPHSPRSGFNAEDSFEGFLFNEEKAQDYPLDRRSESNGENLFIFSRLFVLPTWSDSRFHFFPLSLGGLWWWVFVLSAGKSILKNYLDCTKSYDDSVMNVRNSALVERKDNTACVRVLELHDTRVRFYSWWKVWSGFSGMIPFLIWKFNKNIFFYFKSYFNPKQLDFVYICYATIV